MDQAHAETRPAIDAPYNRAARRRGSSRRSPSPRGPRSTDAGARTRHVDLQQHDIRVNGVLFSARRRRAPAADHRAGARRRAAADDHPVGRLSLSLAGRESIDGRDCYVVAFAPRDRAARALRRPRLDRRGDLRHGARGGGADRAEGTDHRVGADRRLQLATRPGAGGWRGRTCARPTKGRASGRRSTACSSSIATT